MVVLSDLLTKKLIVRSGVYYQINNGSAFSLFSGWTGLYPLSMVIFLILVGYWIYASWKKNLPLGYNLGLALIIGGAIANIIDRLVRGGVIDFIKISLFPIFNFADLAISLGVILIISLSLTHG